MVAGRLVAGTTKGTHAPVSAGAVIPVALLALLALLTCLPLASKQASSRQVQLEADLHWTNVRLLSHDALILLASRLRQAMQTLFRRAQMKGLAA